MHESKKSSCDETKIIFAALKKTIQHYFMKKSIQLLVASTMLMVLIYSCTQNKSSNPALVGSWKMQSIHLKEFDDQVNQLSGQVKSLSDSLAAATDSASQKRIQAELSQYSEYLSNMKARKDSSLKN